MVIRNVSLLLAFLCAGLLSAGPERAAWGAPNRDQGPPTSAEIKKQERSIIARLDDLDRKRVGLKRTRQRLESDISALSHEEKEARLELDRLETRKANLRKSLRHRVKALYLHGRTGLVRLSLASESIKEATLGQGCLVRIVRFDLKLMEDYNVLQRELDGLNRALALRKKRMSGLLQQVAQADMKLAAQRTARARMLLKVDRSREVQRKALADLDRAAAELNARLVSLEESIPKRAKNSASGLLALGKGRLPWPVEGQLSRMADRKRKGVLIKTREGAPVRTVGPGRIIHAGWIKGYGLVVIIDHGARYYTLSAHLEEIRVKTGDRIESSGVIGSSGRAGLASPGVYFEVRHREKTLDSREWLAESSG